MKAKGRAASGEDSRQKRDRPALILEGTGQEPPLPVPEEDLEPMWERERRSPDNPLTWTVCQVTTLPPKRDDLSFWSDSLNLH